MVIPIGDDNETRRSFPFITYLLLAANIALFLLELNRGQEFIKQWAFIPKEFFANPSANAATLISSMFLHGGWAHLIGNMIYLWTFGDNVEDEFGHLPFLLFYLLAGIGAIMAQAFFNPGSNIPNLGASGAIAGVLGAYILLFPRGNVQLLTRNGIINVPAIIAIGLWVLLQFVGVGGELARSTQTGGGVAYMAHLGGFVVGFLLTFLFRSRAARA
jgi:membrane associated rhomboid family serine protease